MRAEDIMIPVIDFLKPDDTLKKAVILLRTTRSGEECIGSKGLPVKDDFGKLVGILSMRDVLKAMLPFYMDMLDLGDFSWEGMVEGIAKRSGERLVRDIMSKVVVAVSKDAPLMECIDHMLKHRVKRLPVIGETGVVIGMLYEHNLFLAVTKEMFYED